MASIDNYRLIKELGNGAYSNVKLAQDEKGEKVALKIIPLDTEEDENTQIEEFYQELVAMAELEHPNICKLKKFKEFSQAKTTDGQIVNVAYLAMDYAEEGELLKCIMNSEKFTEDEARYFFYQLINTLEYIHGRGYYHRDIKPENLLLDSNFNLKIADFGFATKMVTCTIRKGTLNYMSPEMIENRVYNCEQSDLFAAAVTLFNLVTKRVPFVRAETEDKYYQYVIKKDADQYWRSHADDSLSDSFKDLFFRMISCDPASRLSIKEIKEHRWFKGLLLTQEEMFMRMCIRMKRRRFHSFKARSTDTKKRSKSTQLSKSQKKHSNFFKVRSADTLVETVIDFAKRKGYYYCKSKDLYQVELKSGIGKSIITTIISVVTINNRSNKNNCSKPMRCLQFTNVKGPKPCFNEIFSECIDHCNRKLHTS